VVPIKTFAQAKQRLSGVLSPSQRAGLSRAMSRDVVAALAKSAAISRIVICAGDRDAAFLAADISAEFIWEKTLGVTGLNQSVAAVAKRLTAAGEPSMLVVHADIPGLQVADVDSVAYTLASCDIALAPDQHGIGSNLLGWHLATLFRARYGHRSFTRHLTQAMNRGLHLQVCHLSSSRLDIDRPEDLRAFSTLGATIQSTFTYSFIHEHGLAEIAGRCSTTCSDVKSGSAHADA
jgi:2-phospho-L-lactate guanylyltransferase